MEPHKPRSSSSAPFHRALVATDLDAQGAEALRAADPFVQAFHLALGVMNVLPPGLPAHVQTPHLTMTQGLEEGELLEHEALLREHVREASGHERHAYAAIVERGDAVARILHRAEAYEADLVVVGTHSRKGVMRLLIGSTAGEIVRKATCSVLVARPSPAEGPVLVGCDIGGSTPRVLGVARELGAAFKRRVHLLHTLELGMNDAAIVASAVFTGTVPAPVSGDDARSLEKVAEGALAAEMSAAGLSADVEVTEGAPVSRLVARAKELGASLIVVGTHGRRGAARFALGSVAEAVVKEAGCSVLVVR